MRRLSDFLSDLARWAETTTGHFAICGAILLFVAAFHFWTENEQAAALVEVRGNFDRFLKAESLEKPYRRAVRKVLNERIRTLGLAPEDSRLPADAPPLAKWQAAQALAAADAAALAAAQSRVEAEVQKCAAVLSEERCRSLVVLDSCISAGGPCAEDDRAKVAERIRDSGVLLEVDVQEICSEYEEDNFEPNYDGPW